METFICKECQFSFAKEKMPERCPYCGKANTMAIKPSAQDVIDETIDDYKEIEEERDEF